MLPRHTFLDFTQAKSVLKDLAKFHASSFLQWSGQGDRILKELPFLVETQWLPQSQLRPATQSTVEQNFPGIAIFLNQKGFPEESKKFTEVFELSKNFQRMYQLTKIPSKYPSVINHGDLWINNILFKYNKQGKIQQLKFVDYQASRIGSRMFDISYLLFSSVENDTLNNQLHDLLRIYHESFHNYGNLQNGLSTPLKFQNVKLTWSLFLEEWEEYKFFGLTMAIMYASAMFAMVENIPDLEKLSMKDIPETIIHQATTTTSSDQEEDQSTKSVFSNFMESPHTLSRLSNLAKYHLD